MNAFSKTTTPPPATPGGSPHLTIADAARLLATWTDLSPGRAQKMRTALSTAAKLLAPTAPPQLAAAAVPMTCPSLSRLLKAPPATFGLSVGRRTSLCSELRYLLRRLGLHEPNSRGMGLVSAALQSRLRALSRFRKMAIGSFLRFLDTEGIALQAVNATTLSAFQTRCEERTLCSDPADRARQVTATWNWACEHVPGWPEQRLPPPDRADTYSLPLETYPLAFQQDVNRYTERLRGHDIGHIFSEGIFDAGGHGPRRRQRPLRPSSIDGRCWTIRCAAAALVLSGVEQHRLLGLRDLVDPLGHAESIIRFFLKRRGGQSSSMAERVAQTLHLVARDYCALPEKHVTTITEWAGRVELPEPAGLTDKNIRRLRALMQPKVRAMLLCYPIELMRQAAAPTLTPAKAARLAMYATAMEILLICPMRRGNLAGLRLDRHLHQPDPRHSKFSHIIIDADEVKNDNGIHWPIPPESRKLIETYLTRHRHHLVNPGNPYLFGTGDKQRSAQHLGEWLAGAITRDIGVEFNVHLARHFAAWNFLQLNPGQYEVIRQVLGHRNLSVTMAHYVGLEADSAARLFDTTVLRDRHAIRKIAVQAFRQGVGGRCNGGRRPRK
jgi:integrase